MLREENGVDLIRGNHAMPSVVTRLCLPGYLNCANKCSSKINLNLKLVMLPFVVPRRLEDNEVGQKVTIKLFPQLKGEIEWHSTLDDTATY